MSIDEQEMNQHQGYRSRGPQGSPEPRQGVPSRLLQEDNRNAPEPAQRRQGPRLAGPTMRQIFANLQPHAAKILGWAFILWSGGASVYIVRQYIAFLTENAVIQTIVGVVVASFLTLGQAILISQDTEYSTDGYWVLVAVDAFLTAQLNHTFSLKLIENVFLAPFILTTLMHYIGMIVVFKKSRLIAIMTSIGVFLGSLGMYFGAQAWGNPTAIDYAVYVPDIMGGIWTSQLGERFAFGKRNR